jgi:beta-glucosidase
MDRKTARKKAEELVAKMTVNEAASQLMYDSPAIERLGIPAYNWWGEALHGVARAGTATVFPQAIGMAATFDDGLVKSEGEAVSTEGRAKYNASVRHGDRDIYKGLTFWSPNVNIFRDPRWGRGQETYGEDPYLTSRMGMAYVRGLQGDGEVLRSAACAKHFAVHSGPEAVRHGFDAKVSAKDLYETYLPAFEACVREADVEGVMGAYNRVNGEPCCASYTLLTKILRGRWDFGGHVVSDCMALHDIHANHMVTSTPAETSALALKNGCDVNCGNTYHSIMDALRADMITETDIREAAVRLFMTRYRLGLFERTEYDSIPITQVECPEHTELAKRAAQESIVLLKNNGILPLNLSDGKAHTVAVIGPDADSRAALAGNYHGTASRYVTVLEGLEDNLPDNVRILYSEGSHLYKDKVEPLAGDDDRLSEAVDMAENSELVIAVVGLDETLEGEEGDTGNSYASGDKPDLLLPASQRRLLRALYAAGRPVILCLMSGSAIDLSYDETRAAAIFELWYPGAQGGNAFADILTGRVSPSGKLPVTFYSSENRLPEFTDYSMKGRTYRYIGEEPLYPFGYGLSYADCDVLRAEAARDDDVASGSGDEAAGRGVVLKAECRNNSTFDTMQVLEVYCRDIKSPNAVPNTSLCAFRKIMLPGSSESTVEIRIDGRAFSSVNDDGERVYDSDRYILYAGFGQPDRRTEELTGKRCAGVEISFD